ncbi:hypothetical protein OVS_02490 [Mycoplasma ovis str. Michigan]|uniref:Uncharacterized protein n=1 Tax=Mycoplasma ovis str. Michigan TaxID=1415773 RepID=A0ABM5P1M6_9MOLU|nr:hypothetical protein [Mycoplasma ovis]AHC40336.1 hypothetical protein OVS_02490 [Mycoplasma ovis str. Michigan]
MALNTKTLVAIATLGGGFMGGAPLYLWQANKGATTTYSEKAQSTSDKSRAK